MNQDERKLIGAVRVGDRQAFDTLYGRFAPRVFTFTLLLIPPPARRSGPCPPSPPWNGSCRRSAMFRGRKRGLPTGRADASNCAMSSASGSGAPPAIATWDAPTFALGPQKALKDGCGRLTLKLSNGQYIRDRRQRRPIAEQVTALIRSLTNPAADADFPIGPNLTVSAWRQTQRRWNGRPALRFARTVHVHRLMPLGPP